MIDKDLIVEKESDFAREFSNWSSFVHPINAVSYGVIKNESGYCYNHRNGEYLGRFGARPKNNVFIAKPLSERYDKKTKKTITSVGDIAKLPITHNNFTERAATIYGESTAYISNDFLELVKEMAAIAFVYLKNKRAYGNKSDPAKLFRRTPLHKRAGKMQLANWAVINSIVPGGFDYSYGADMWDGQEQALYPITDDRGWDLKKGFEIHMNTMGWKISDAHYAKWKKNVGSIFMAPQVKRSPKNYKKGRTKYRNKGLIRLYSKAVYGKTIFWEER